MNKTTKKLFSLGLSSVLLLSAIPMTALAASEGSIASDPTVGVDEIQNAKTGYTEITPNLNDEQKSKAKAYVTVDDGDVIVSVPEKVIVSGVIDPTDKLYKGAYQVKVEGDFAGNKTVLVEPDSETVKLTQNGKENIKANINQDKTEFTYLDIVNNTNIENGLISTDKLTAGSWNGLFNFNISLKDMSKEFFDITNKLDPMNNRNVGLNGQYMPRTVATTYAIKVQEGEKYKVSGWTQGSQALYCLRDNIASTGSTVIDKYPATVDYSYQHHEDVEVVIPAGVNYMEMCVLNDHIADFKVEKQGNTNVSNVEKTLLKYNDKKYIVICFDDTLEDISDVIELFDKYNVPANFATIPENLNRTTNSGKTAKDVLLEAQANGHEVLAHNAANGLLTAESTDADYKMAMSDTKKELEANGFVVNGYLNPGGTKNGLNSDTQDWNKTFAACKAAGYLYSDMSGRPNKYIEPYTMGRFYFDTTDIETFKTEMDNWWKWGYHYKAFVNHEADNLDFIEQVIQYCLENDIQIVTYNTLYNTYMN